MLFHLFSALYNEVYEFLKNHKYQNPDFFVGENIWKIYIRINPPDGMHIRYFNKLYFDNKMITY